MSDEHIRRGITWFLLLLLAIVALSGDDGKGTGLILAVIGALIARVVAFYFPLQPRRPLE